jgi:hypothetical protein
MVFSFPPFPLNITSATQPPPLAPCTLPFYSLFLLRSSPSDFGFCKSSWIWFFQGQICYLPSVPPSHVPLHDALRSPYFTPLSSALLSVRASVFHALARGSSTARGFAGSSPLTSFAAEAVLWCFVIFLFFFFSPLSMFLFFIFLVVWVTVSLLIYGLII